LHSIEAPLVGSLASYSPHFVAVTPVCLFSLCEARSSPETDAKGD